MQPNATQMAAILAAPFVGSFLGQLIVALPEGGRILWGRSACGHCGQALALRDLTPIASWFLLRGRCRSCGGAIDKVHVVAEIGALLLAVWASLTVPEQLLWPTVLFGWALLTVALVDLKSLVIPNALTLPLGALGLAAPLLWDRAALLDHAIGAAAGYPALTLVAVAYRRLRNRSGLGGGDARLLAAIGAWVAWQGLPTVVLCASLLGLCHALVLAAQGERITAARRLPFGPHLCLAGWLVWLYGPLVLG